MKNVLFLILATLSGIANAQIDCTGATSPVAPATTFGFIAPTTNAKYYASGAITAVGYTQNTTTTYISNASISLGQGFKATASTTATFKAMVGTCILNSARTLMDDSTIFIDKKITLYPNPTNATITVKWENYNITQFTIIGLDGRVIFEKQINDSIQEANFDVSRYANGVYSVIILTDDGNIAKKFVKN